MEALARNELAESHFEISLRGNVIALHGDLDDSPGVLATCRRSLEKVPKFSHLRIESSDARIVPEGVTIWIEAAKQFLTGCDLVYAPSQLGLILKYDERYDHPKSTFEEWGLSAVVTAAAGI